MQIAKGLWTAAHVGLDFYDLLIEADDMSGYSNRWPNTSYSASQDREGLSDKSAGLPGHVLFPTNKFN